MTKKASRRKKTSRKSSGGSEVPSKLQSLIVWAQVFFFFSGATALLYQVLWTRRLTLVFGHSVLAISTVVTVFMAGLALGSLTFGRWTDGERFSKSPHLLLGLYAALEIFIAVWALLSLPLLQLAEVLYFRIAQANAPGLTLQLACFALSSLVLLAPTTAMGATMPVLSKLLVKQTAKLGPILSRLYGVNTLGALVGASLGGFLLLPNLGLKASMILGASANFGIGLAAWWLARKQSREETSLEAVIEQSGEKRQLEGAEEKRELALRLVPFTFFLGGIGSMAYQVAWTRGLCLSIGSSVYAFSTILVTFLGGLALGSLLYGRWTRFSSNPKVHHLTWMYLGIALSGLVSIPALEKLPYLYRLSFPLAHNNFSAIMLLNLALSGLILFLPTLIMGMGFPLATALYNHSLSQLGRSVGEVYGLNTLGCILGAFFSGFLLLPNFGAQWTLKTATLIYFLAALLLLVFNKNQSRKPAVLFLIGLGSLGTLFLPRWDTGVMASGVAIYSEANPHDFATLSADRSFFQTPAFYRDGLSSTVSFHYKGLYDEVPHMKVNGKVDASMGAGDRLTQYFLGYLPTLLHPQARRVAIIGLGGGFTVEAVKECPGVEEIVCVELEPAVVDVSDFWKPFNDAALDDPRVSLVENDGRTFVLTSPEAFDVLISEPSNPWIAGIGNLFTTDFYESAQKKLNPDGIMCQWFNLYAVSVEDLKMVIRGFYQTFPEGQVWQSSGGDLVLLGSQKELTFPLDRIKKVFSESPAIQKHFFEAQLYLPEHMPGYFLMTREQALDFAGKGPFNTDDRPLLEFSAPLSLYRSGAVEENLKALWGGVRQSLPPGFEEDEELKRLGVFGANSREHHQRTVDLLKEYGDSHPELYIAAALHKLETAPGEVQSVGNIFASSREKFGTYPLRDYLWAEFELSQGRLAQAVALYLNALADPPPGSAALMQQRLAICLLSLNDPARAVEPLLNAATFSAHDPVSLALAGSAFLDLQEDAKAETALRESVARAPHYPYAKLQLSYALFNQGKQQEAESQLLDYLKLAPESDLAWFKLGVCLEAMDKNRESRKAYRRALQLNPKNEAAEEALRGYSLGQ